MTKDNNHNNIHPNPSVFWKHRRRLAYVSFICSVIQTFLLGVLAYLKPESIEVMGAVIAWSYSFYGIVVTGYLTNTAIGEYVKRKTL